MLERLAQQLTQRKEANLYRERVTVEGPQQPHLAIGGKSLVSFCSNDYLGLANHPLVVEAFTKAAHEYGVGGGASHLVCGHHKEHHLLEEEFARLTGRDKALLFSTGYMANLGVITALLDQKGAVFEDKWNHASLLDGGRLSGARFQRYLHNDMDNLEARLLKSSADDKLICVDGVFSMDGDLAPLDKLAQLAKLNDALLMVDDAHGFGTLGANGLGVCEHFGLGQDDVPILMCTLGKAMGSFGALVAGPSEIIDYLIQYARPYIYTTAMPPAVAAATRVSLTLLEQEKWRRERLGQMVEYFKKGAESLELTLMPSDTAIQPIVVGDDELVMQWHAVLKSQDVWVSAIRPPTVPAGTSRLRVTLSAEHEEKDIDRLLESLALARRLHPVEACA